LLEYVPDLLVTVFTEGVEVLSDRALYQEWLLWNIANTFAKQVEPYTGDVTPVYENLSFARVYEAEKDLEDGTLASACAAHNANFHSWLHFEREFRY